MKHLLLLIVAACACSSPVQSGITPLPKVNSTIIFGLYPDPKLTPGAVDPSITEQVVTAPGFTTKTYRAVSVALKQEVCKEYGVAWADHAKYEIDHFVSIELGGSESISNLWPEPLHLNVGGVDEGAKSKDRVEDVLGRMVHSGKLPLVDAQNLIRGDWVAVYKKLIGPLPKFGTGS